MDTLAILYMGSLCVRCVILAACVIYYTKTKSIAGTIAVVGAALILLFQVVDPPSRSLLILSDVLFAVGLLGIALETKRKNPSQAGED